MRVESHPRQSQAISLVVCCTAAWSTALALQRFGWTHATLQGAGLCLGVALLIGSLRAGTWAAALVGGLLMAAMYGATVAQPDGPWWVSAIPPLLLLLVLTLLATRFRRYTKEHAGLGESRRGRSAAQVCANLGIAALAATFAWIPGARTLALLGMTAAFVEATADTLSSEIGQAIRGRTILLTTGQCISPGTDGGMSIAGTLAGICGSLLVAAACQSAMQLTMHGTLIAWFAGLAGWMFDSLLGATLEHRGLLGNNAVNFCSTAFAAALAALIGLWAR
ncbi:MAG TPA: DUF92 domain-containing protein [Acidobacteriaceae bacterium]|nr:DUF92 domain-containing protein [Acidobacteriaceae bacterium]